MNGGFFKLIQLEEHFAAETEGSGDKHGGELLGGGVVFGSRAVEETARGGDLVLDIRQFVHQTLEILVGLELRVVFRNRQKPGNRAAEHALRFHACLGVPAPGRTDLRPRVGDIFENLLLVRGVTLDGFDKLRHQIVALLKLHVDIGKGVVPRLPQGDKAVIQNDHHEGGDDDYRKYNPFHSLYSLSQFGIVGYLNDIKRLCLHKILIRRTKIMSVFTSRTFASCAASGNDWREASKSVLEQLETIRTEGDGFNFGFLYISDMLAEYAPSILNLFRSVTRIENWIGSVGMGIIGTGEAFVDKPAISALIGRFPEGEFCVFPEHSVEEPPLHVKSLREWLEEHTPMLVCVHADPMADEDPMPRMAELESLCGGFIVGGLTSSRASHDLFANGICEDSIGGALFSDKIPVATALSQGCRPFSDFRTITRADGTTIFELDGVSALRCLLEDLRAMDKKADDLPIIGPLPDLRRMDSSDEIPESLLPLFRGEVHIALPISESDQKDYLVRNIMALDPGEESLTISQTVSIGDNILFVQRTEDIVLEDLKKSLDSLVQRVTAERGRFEPQGALYISCIARGFSETGTAAQREMDVIRAAIGNAPLAGFYAGGEISNARLYGYTGVLVLFF